MAWAPPAVELAVRRRCGLIWMKSYRCRSQRRMKNSCLLRVVFSALKSLPLNTGPGSRERGEAIGLFATAGD